MIFNSKNHLSSSMYALASTIEVSARELGHRVSKDNSGGTLIAFAVGAVMMFSFAAAAVDYGYWTARKSKLQSTADAAALGAARQIILSPGDDPQTIALAAARTHVLAQLGSTMTPVVTVAPDGLSVRVRLAEQGLRLLSGVISGSQPTIAGEAVAAFETGSTAPACIIALDPAATIGIDFSLGGTLTAHSCSIWSNATNSFSSIDANGSGLVTAARTCATGGIAKGSLVINPAAQSNCVPVPDPLAAWSPPAVPTCDYFNVQKFSSGAVTISPGVYCGGMKASSNTQLTMQPGVYYMVDGGFKVNGGASVQGSGVTILTYGADAAVDVSTSMGVTLTAPTTGPTAGLVFASGRTEPQSISKIGGGANMVLEGTVYLPTHHLGFGGNSETNIPSPLTSLIAGTLKFHGGATFEIRSDPGASSIPPFVGIVTQKTFAKLSQ